MIEPARLAQLCQAGSRVAGVGQCRRRRHDAHRVVGLGRDPRQRRQALVAQLVDEIRGGGDAGPLRHLAEHAQAVFRQAHGAERIADQPHHRKHGGELAQLATGLAVGEAADAFDIRIAVDAGAGQHRRVHIHQMHAGVHHHHRPVGRHRVQVAHAHALAAEEDGIEAPADQRLVRRQAGGEFTQARGHRREALQARPHTAVRPTPVVVADIGELPHAAFRQMAVALHQPRHQDVVGVALVQLGRSPAGQVFAAAHAQDAAIAHRHVRGARLGRVHRQDGAGGKNGGVGGLRLCRMRGVMHAACSCS
ncbi:Uncharacterised protein [Achromobacter xylosoxidans]|nr:Uncharacterised protein [Achromobacter xylosoxidans]